MAAVSFPYIGIRIPPSDPFPDGQFAWRPLARAILLAPTGKRLRCIACLDTGADSCVFPSNFASILGLDISKMKSQKTAGVGGTGIPAAYHDLEIDLGQGIRFQAYAGFSPGVNALGFGLLGQAGFFEQFNVSFFHKDRRFSIDRS